MTYKLLELELELGHETLRTSRLMATRRVRVEQLDVELS